MRTQTSARELALKALYQHDLMGGRSPEELRSFCRQNAGPEVAELAASVLEGCLENQEEIDEVIRETAENWKLERMATSDRNILRLGVYELLFRPQTPPKVAINEAIELAKKYSTENSPTFVNGVLDKIYSTRVKTKGEEKGEDEEPNTTAPGEDPGGSRRNAPSPDSTVGAEGQRAGKDPSLRADMHVHSTVSDGTVEPGALPRLALGAGLGAFALTDHDAVRGVASAREAAEGLAVEVVAGVELTSYWPENGAEPEREVHIAGLFIDDRNPELVGRLDELRRTRRERVVKMCEKLRGLGLEVETEAVLERGADGAVGRVHVAQELVGRGYSPDISSAFEQYLLPGGPVYVPKERLSPPEAIELVKSAGGCPVLCHPKGLDGVEERLPGLIEQGLRAVEVHYPTHTPRDKHRLMELARQFDLLIAGGSDFHGEAKPHINIGQEAVSGVELNRIRECSAVG